MAKSKAQKAAERAAKKDEEKKSTESVQTSSSPISHESSALPVGDANDDLKKHPKFHKFHRGEN